MANQITGRVYHVSPTETRDYNNRTFFERILTIDATRRDQYTGEEMFPNFPQFNISGEDKCTALNALKVGEVVTVTFDLRGVKYADKNTGEEKFFTRAYAFKIDPYARLQPEVPMSADHSLPPLPDKAPEFEPTPKEPADDLPFA